MEMNMMPPAPGEAPPGLPIPPGGAMPGEAIPPMDALNQGPIPAEGGIEGLMALLGGGGGGGGLPPGMEGGLPPGMEGEGPPGLPPELIQELDDDNADMEMSGTDHIRQAIKHLMMAMADESDDERGHGITKGMGLLQGILGGDQKKAKILGPAGPAGA
jgi:hypothetical protein